VNLPQGKWYRKLVWVGHFAGPVLFLLIWQVASVGGVVDARFVPPPTKVFSTFLNLLFGLGPPDQYSGTWLLHARDSSYRVLVGFSIASVAGVTIGILIGWFRLFAAIVDPIIQLLRPIPITAWVPFTVVFFGIRDGSAFFLIALGAFFPIVVNTAAGVQRTPIMLVRAAQMLGIRPHMMLPRVVLPSALPSIFTGLRVGIGLAWVLVVVAEMLAVKTGLGFVMWDAYYFVRMDVIICAMLTVGFLGFVCDRAILGVSAYMLRWSRGL
jgi:NitT/TauT family transport system permease protein